MMTLAALIAGGALLGQTAVLDSDGGRLPDVSELRLLNDESGRPLIMRMPELDVWPTVRPGPHVDVENRFSPWVYQKGNHERFLSNREYGCVRKAKDGSGDEFLLLVKFGRDADDRDRPTAVAGWMPADKLTPVQLIENGDGQVLTSLAGLTALRDENGRPRIVWAPRLGLRPTIRPGAHDPKTNPDSPWNIRNRVGFMEAFVGVLEKPDAEGERSLLLARSTGDPANPRSTGDPANPRLTEIAGWLSASQLLLSPKARTIGGGQAPEKVLIVDNLAARVQSQKTEPLETRYLRLGPDSKALVRANAPLAESMTWRFVFAEDGEWSLLGNHSSFDPRNPASVVLGWIRTKQLCPWPSREALALVPQPNQDPVLIFRTESDAKAQAQGGPPLLRESASEARPRGLAPAPPFPILSSKRLINGKRLYEIAAVGSLDEGRNAQARGNGAGVPADPGGGERIDILFVIDATDSNQKFFPDIQKSVDNIIQSFREAARRIESRPGARPPRLRMAVSAYTDGDNDRDAFKTMGLVDADEASDLVARRLSAWRRKDPGNLDFPERVYGGLNEAIDAAGFSEYAVKLVILMGDAHDKLKRGDPSMENLIERIAPFQGPELPISFRAVHTHKPDVETNQGSLYRDLFRFREEVKVMSDRVASRIQDANPGAANPALFCGYEELSPNGLQAVAALADPQLLKGLLAQAANRAEQIRLQRRDWPLEGAPALSQLLQQAKLDRANLAAQGVFDLCVKGYAVDARDGRWRKKILVNERELRSIAALLKELTAVRPTPDAISGALSDALAARRMKPDQTLNDWLRGFMDYDFKSLLLSGSADAASKMSPADLRTELNRLRGIAARLESVMKSGNELQSGRADQPERVWRFLDADAEWP